MGKSSPSNSRYVVVSADTHGGTTPHGYRDFLDPVYRDEFEDWLANVYPTMEKGFYSVVEQSTKTWGADEEGPHTDAFLQVLEDGMGDATHRVRALESDGVVASVIYPGASVLCTPPFATGADLFGMRAKEYSRAHRLAGVRAYNRWLAAYCGEYPAQLKGVIQVLGYDDLDESIELIEEAAEAGLRGGIALPNLNIDQPGLHTPHWDRLWSVCEHYELPVNSHAAFQVDPRLFGQDDSGLNALLYFATAQNFQALPLAIFMLGGVLDRHPTLRIVFSEQYADWIPRSIGTLQERFEEGFGMEAFRSSLSLDPRSYWERNFGVGATFMTQREAGMRYDIGLSTIMWGSDFPHPEGTYPHTRESLRLSFSEVPADELRMILGANACRIYGFELDELQPIADRVGPTVEDLSTPLDEVPAGFRRFSVKPSEDRDLVAAPG
jgi:predicted TIM-barrel fold metal-dependent hydrolase